VASSVLAATARLIAQEKIGHWSSKIRIQPVSIFGTSGVLNDVTR
jgi:hypothetical protein